MPSTTARVRARVLMETLEPRILYSADLAAVAALAGGDIGLAQEQRLQATTQTADQTAVRTEIAFVDLGIPEARLLVDGLLAERAAGRPIEVVTIAADEDGLAVISHTLDERQAAGKTCDAVHVFSHGQSGVVALGTSTLDADSLLRRAGEIAGWGSALSARADLMLYGCDVAAGANGLFLIEGLAALTGADVAASDDLTGSAARGGDWLLEQHTGQIEAAVAADAALQQTWDGVLGSETQVNLTTAGNQNTDAETRGSQQAVTLDATGNYTVVWTSGGQDGGGKGVYVRRFAYDGTALTGEIQVNTTTAKDQKNARIVGDSAGNFAVVWSGSDQDGTPSSVYLRRFAADGTALTGEIRANATSTGSQSNAVVGMNASNGTVVVAWQGAGPGAGAEVFFRRFAVDGTALDAADQPVATSGTLGGEQNPVVAMDSTGRFVVAWDRSNHVYFQRFDAAGVATGSQIQMDNALSKSIGASIAMDASGNFALAYREQTTLPGIWGRAFNADGSARGFWFNADTGDSTASGDSTSPSISLAADGSGVVVYQRTGDGDKMGIYARKFSPGGVVQGSVFLVNQSTTNDQRSASVAVRDTNHFVVVWSGDSAADKDGVYARTFEPANTAPQITSDGGGATAALSVAENTTAVTTVHATDADWPAPALVYAITGGVDQAKFAIDSQSGVLKFVAPPNFELPADAGSDNVYNVVVSASDGQLSSAQALAVTVTNVDDKVSARPDTATIVYQTATSVDVLANDLLGAGTTLTLLDLVQPVHGKAAVSAGQVVYTPDAGYVGSDTLQYRVIDGSEGLAGYWSLDDDIGANAGEPAPVAGVHGQALQFNGVDDRVALAGVSYTKEFTLSYWFKLADNTGTGYRYLYADGTAGAQNSLNVYFIENATSTASGVKNVLRTSLVDSNDGTAIANTSALDIPVTGLLDNRWHQYTLTTVTGTGSSVYIDGTLRASSSQGGDTLTTSGSVLLGANSALSAARFLTGALDDVALYHHTTAASAVATLESGPGAIGTVTLDVVPANTQAPVITSGGGADAAAVSVAENGTAVTVVTATDADAGGPALAYTIVGGADQARFSMDAASGAVVFRTAPNFEQPTDTGADNVYDLTVQVSDGVHVDTQQLRVVVTDANEYAVSPITDADPGAEAVDENAAIGTTVGFTASAVDADGTTNAVTYSLDDSAGGRFAIDATTGVVKVAGLLDAETASSHTLLVQATSVDGSSQTLAVTVAVRDMNEASVTAPVDADGAPNTVSENAAIGSAVGLTASAADADATNNTVTYALTDNAGGRFAIDASSGVVTVASALDAERALSHTVVVQATSADGSTSTRSVTIAVQDVNESAIGAITDLNSAAESVREDAAIGAAVGFQAHAVDPDATNSAVTYALTNNAGGRFAIDTSSGVVTVVSALDAETALSHTVVVQATSADGSTSTRSVTIAVQDVNESAIGAITDLNSAAESVREDAAIGAAVGFQAHAVDPDATNSAVTYALTNNAGGRFEIGASSGVVTVASALDAETALSHTIFVQATSADGSVSTRSVTIAVQDVNESAVGAISDLDGAAESVREDAAIGTAIGYQAHAVDADVTNNTVIYSLALNFGNRFAIDATSGVVTVAAALDVETTSSYLLLVRAVSSDGSFKTHWLGIAVQDVNEFSVTTPVDANSATNAVNDNAVVGTRVGITASARDADATQNQITYTLADNAAGRFAINSGTGVVTLLRSVAADSGSTLNLVLQATSADGSVATQALTVAVSQTNLYAPVIQSDGGGASAALTVQENSSDPVTTVVATDADVSGVPLSYQIVGGADAARFTLDAGTGVLRFVATPDAEQPIDAGGDNRYDLIVEASDGVRVDTQTLSVVVQDVNEAAISAVADVNLAADTVQENAAIGTVVGVQALAIDSDATNNTVTYTLDDTAGGRFAIDVSTGVVTVAGLLDAEAALSHTILVRAASSDGSATTLALTIAVQDVNEYGVGAITDADGPANSVREDDPVGTIVGLTAQAQDLDATANAVTYSLSDDAGGRFAIDATTGVVTIAQALDAEAAQSHSIVVQALSADGSMQTQAFSIVVRDVDEFDLVAVNDVDGAASAVAENAAVGTRVGITAQSVDADVTNNTVTYALLDSAGGRFAIGATTGVVMVAGPLDAETATAHTIVVQATSSDFSLWTQAYSIAVRDVDEFDLVAINDVDGAANAVAENAAVGTLVGITALSVDADVTNNSVTYSLDDTAGGRFAIDASTGVVTVAGLLDAETALSHTIVVRAASSDGSATMLALTIAVQDVNEYGVGAISDADAQANSVREDDPVGTIVGLTAQAQDPDATANAVTYSLSDSAGGRFAIDATTGVVTIAQALDAETAQSHSIVVRALSADGSVQTQAFSIAVRDVDEFDLVAISDMDGAANAVAENAAVGTRVGIAAQSVDADVTNNTVTYALADNAGGRFAIDAATGVVTVAGPLDAEAAQSHTIVVQATSSDRSQWTQAYTVAVTDVDEFDLVAVSDGDTAADAVAENAAVGTTVGITAQSVDADVSQNTVTYALLDDAGGRFAIDASSGVVSVAGALDAETATRYTLAVQATSADGSVWAQAFTVQVTDVDEFDLVAVDDTDVASNAVAETAAPGTPVGITARAIDADVTSNTVGYALLDNAGGRFVIDANSGVITVAGALDAETAMQHTLVVQATSADGSQWTQAFTVQVMDVDEFDLIAVADVDPAASVLPENAAVGTLAGLTAHAVDADASNNTVTYALADNAGGRFAIDASSGVVTVAGALDAETATHHTLVVQATSADGSVWAQAFTVQVTDVDEFDLVAVDDADVTRNAVAENAAVGTTVGLRASSVDADLTTNAVTYALDDSAGGRFAVDAATGVVTLARAVPDEGVATRTVVLRATSADGSTVAASFDIAILPINEQAPVIDSDGGGAGAALAVDEGQTAVTQVLAHDNDLPADTLRYTVSGGADAALFTVDAATGVLRFAAAPDAESPRDQGADNVYDVNVQVSDGLYTDEQALRITVQPLNDTAPVITSDGGGATAVRHVAENTLAVTQVQARDADLPAGTLTYAVSGGADAALFTVDATTGALRWRAAPDRETPRDAGADGVYDLTVRVSDGLHTATQSLAVLVDNVDEAPRLDTNALVVLEGGMARPVLLASDVDTPAAALVYTVQDLTGGRFEQTTAPGVALTRFTQAEVDAGVIRFVADGNEAAPAYRLTLVDTTTTLAPQAAQVAFTPVNDAPVSTAVNLGTVDEDTARVITTADLLVGASDAEGDVLSVSTLRLTGGEGVLVDLGGGRWRFDPAADWHGAVTLAGEVSDGQARVALVAALQVQAVNDAPRITSSSGAATVALDLAENTTEVTTVTGTDVDADAPLHYAVVGGADAARFQIDAATGVLSFRQPPDREQPADVDGDNRYDVTVEVSDGQLTAQQALQITVTNVDEAPVVTLNTLLVSDSAVTLVLQASDQDSSATALIYRVDHAQGGQFELATAPGRAVATFTQADLDAARVTWVASAGSTAAAFALRLSDGHSEVQVGSPMSQRVTAAAAVEMTVAAVAAGDTSAAPSAGASATTAAATPVAAAARRVESLLPPPPDGAGDGALGPGLRSSEDTGQGRGGGVRPETVDAPVARSPAARAAAVAEPPVEVALDLPSEGAEAPRRLVTDMDLWGSRNGTSLAEQMDRLRQEVADAQQAGMVSLASTALVSTGLSVGYVIWLVRGGVLMTSLMSVVPAWAGMDPLPVLAEMRRHGAGGVAADSTDDDGDSGDDPIEQLFSKARRLLVRPVAGSPVAPEPPEGSA